VSSLAPSAFLASAAGTRGLQDQLLLKCQASIDTAVTQVLAHWSTNSSSGVTCPTGEAAAKQREWDTLSITADAHTVMTSQSNRRHQARLLAVSAPHSGDWLHALPITSCGLRLDDEAVRVAVGLRLGATLCEPHKCPCGSDVDAEGTHGLAC
jgi:hypothetical protein